MDTGQRLSCSRQMSAAEAAQYRDPAFVLGGWVPTTLNATLNGAPPGATPAAMAPGGTLVAAWSAPAGHLQDLIGLYRAGDPDTAPLAEQATGTAATTGSRPWCCRPRRGARAALLPARRTRAHGDEQRRHRAVSGGARGSSSMPLHRPPRTSAAGPARRRWQAIPTPAPAAARRPGASCRLVGCHCPHTAASPAGKGRYPMKTGRDPLSPIAASPHNRRRRETGRPAAVMAVVLFLAIAGVPAAARSCSMPTRRPPDADDA